MTTNTRLPHVFFLVLILFSFVAGFADKEGSSSQEDGISHPEAIERLTLEEKILDGVKDDNMGKEGKSNHHYTSIRNSLMPRKILDGKEGNMGKAGYNLWLQGMKPQRRIQAGVAEAAETHSVAEDLTKARFLNEEPKNFSADLDARSQSSKASDCTHGDHANSGFCPGNHY